MRSLVRLVPAVAVAAARHATAAAQTAAPRQEALAVMRTLVASEEKAARSDSLSGLAFVVALADNGHSLPASFMTRRAQRKRRGAIRRHPHTEPGALGRPGCGTDARQALEEAGRLSLSAFRASA